MPATPIEAAADALLRIVVTGERERNAAANPSWAAGRPWIDTMAPASTDALDLAGLAADPIGTACRAELRRIGHVTPAAHPGGDVAELSVEIAQMDPAHSGWRAIALETAWAGIGGSTPRLQPREQIQAMKRPLTTSFSAPAPGQAPQAEPEQPPIPTWREVAPIVSALIITLEAIETGPKAGPAMRAHRSAMRRQGEAAAALGGHEAMEAVLHQVEEVDPARAERRLALVREAWTGLPGWLP